MQPVSSKRPIFPHNTNDTSVVIKEWRRLQIVSASAAVVSVPDRVQQASQSALSALWTGAQELANEALRVAQTSWDAERAEAEKLRAIAVSLWRSFLAFRLSASFSALSGGYWSTHSSLRSCFSGSAVTHPRKPQWRHIAGFSTVSPRRRGLRWIFPRIGCPQLVQSNAMLFPKASQRSLSPLSLTN